MWYVYILRCNDRSFYIGITREVTKRLLRHNAGKASKYTKFRRPVEVVYTEAFATKVKARNREIEIKNFSIRNKKRLTRFGAGRRFPSALEI